MVSIKALLISSLASIVLGEPEYTLHCSIISGTPCKCPAGTTYSESVSVAFIGASASDTGGLVNDFFDPSWTGIKPSAVHGPQNLPGLAVRDVNISTSVGVYSFSERLTFRFVYPDGSFEQAYEQKGNVPYRSGNGSFSGYWVTLRGRRIFQNETLVLFSNYACQTGHPIDYAAFHESALKNATSLLAASGKIRGINSGPISAQSSWRTISGRA